MLTNLFLTNADLILWVKNNLDLIVIICVVACLCGVCGLCAFIIFAVKTNGRIAKLEASTNILINSNEQLQSEAQASASKLEEYKAQAEQTIAEANAKRDAIVAEAQAKAEEAKQQLLDKTSILDDTLENFSLD